MSKLAQKDLLKTEAFSDIMKGLAAGIAAAGPEITEPFKAVAQPFKKGIEAYIKSNPVAYVKDKLKKEYYNTFYVKSLANFKKYNIPGEPTKGGRVGVMFDAIRVKSPQSTSNPNTNQTATPVSGAPASNPAAASSPTNTPPTPMATYYAILLKGPEGWDMEVRDENNRVVRGQKERKTKQRYNWDDEYEGEGFPTEPDYEDFKLWLDDYLPPRKDRRQSIFNNEDQIDKIISSLLSGTTFQSGDKLNAQQVQTIKNELKRRKIFESSQMDTLFQLKVIAERYSHTK